MSNPIKLGLMFLILVCCTGCKGQEQKHTFLFDSNAFENNFLTVKYYNESEDQPKYFTIKDSATLCKIFKIFDSYSAKDYVRHIPANYSDDFFDFDVKQKNNKRYTISTGFIKGLETDNKGFIYIFRIEPKGSPVEGKFYSDSLFTILNKMKNDN